MNTIRVPPFAPAGNGVTVNFAVPQSPLVGKIQFDDVLPANQPNPNTSPSIAMGINKSRNVRLFNAGPDIVFFELVGSQGAQTASVSGGVPLAANTAIVLNSSGATFVAATSPTKATLYATPGDGGL